MKSMSYVVWKKYQRRATVLAPLLNAELVCFPHKYFSKALRPVDYFRKHVQTARYLHQKKPAYVLQLGETMVAVDKEITKEIFVKKIK